MQSYEDKPCTEATSITVRASSLARCDSEPERDAGVVTQTSFFWDLRGRANRCWPGGSPLSCRR